MNKKMYFEPKEEVIFLQMSSALLAGSNDLTDPDEDTGEAPKSDQPI